MTAIETTGQDLASVLSNISQQMIEGVPIGVLRDCLRIVQNTCEVIDETTGELDPAKIAALKRADPRWWSDGRIEQCRIVEHWKWETALALADMPESVRQLRINLLDAENRCVSSNSPIKKEAARRAKKAFDDECVRIGWSE